MRKRLLAIIALSTDRSINTGSFDAGQTAYWYVLFSTPYVLGRMIVSPKAIAISTEVSAGKKQAREADVRATGERRAVIGRTRAREFI